MIKLSPSDLADVSAWMRSRPAAVQAVMRRFPPGCFVHATRPLAVPPPGVVGRVVSYFEAGTVGVEDGSDVRGECDVAWLVVDGFDTLTPKDVATILDERPERKRRKRR